jgi:YD repeat-containing protein
MRPLYLPRVTAAVDLGAYTHRYEYDAAGARHAARTDEVRRCVHCGTDDPDETYTYCGNCGSINCEAHTETERLVGEPVCTGCSVTETFFFAEKHFFDEANADAFREEYEAMPFYRKALENRPLAIAVALGAACLLLLAAAVLL